MAEADPGKIVNVHEAKTHFSKLLDRARQAGDESLARRPMARIIKPLAEMGAWERARGWRTDSLPIGRKSPARSGRPPIPVMTWVEALPITSGTSIPPPTHR